MNNTSIKFMFYNSDKTKLCIDSCKKVEIYANGKAEIVLENNSKISANIIWDDRNCMMFILQKDINIENNTLMLPEQNSDNRLEYDEQYGFIKSSN